MYRVRYCKSVFKLLPTRTHTHIRQRAVDTNKIINTLSAKYIFKRSLYF